MDQSWNAGQTNLGSDEERRVKPMTKRRTVGLIAFLKGSADPKAEMPGCANFDHHSDGCLCGDVCLVQTGQRCLHFEESVLPTAGDIGLRESVHSQYRKHVSLGENGELGTGPVRRCPDCGSELRPRQRYCPNCSKRRRRQSYRRAREKQRPMCNTDNVKRPLISMLEAPGEAAERLTTKI